MKFIHLLFSRMLLCCLFFALQIALLCVALLSLDLFPIMHFGSILLALVVFCIIIHRKECPEFKIPWLVLLFLVPLFTVFAYLFFAMPKLTKKQAAAMRKIEQRAAPPARGTASLPSFADGIATYLTQTAGAPVFEHNRITYLPNGKDFFSALLSALKEAKSYIFMEYFIIGRGKMWDAILSVLKQKAAQGVEVRVLYDDIGTAGRLPARYFKTLCKAGIRCAKFNTFRPILSGIHNNRDHRKITVVDGKISFVGGINLADEYIGEIRPYGDFKDTAVKIEGSATDTLVSLFLQAFDGNAKAASPSYDGYFVKEHERFEGGGFIQPFGDGPRPFYKEQIAENNFLNLLYHAKRYCFITTPYLIIDHTLKTALRAAAKRGVDVRIITPHVPDKKTVFKVTRSNYAYLLDAGVRIYEYTPGFIHAKMLLCDDEMAFIGTVNLDYRSLVHHFECGAMLYQSPCLKDIKEDFEQTLLASEEITKENLKIGRLSSFKNTIVEMFSPML